MNDSVPSIMIVDDEEMVLSSLRGVFALQTDYDLLEASNPRLALEEVKRVPVDVVISDFLMPEMNGIEFLKEVRELQPDSARVLLTGYADKENAIKAINDVGLYHYLEKPWDNDALLNIVKNALAEKSLRHQLGGKIRELNELLREHGELETKHRFLEREMEMAARVQRSLLPESFPDFPDYAFSRLYEPSEAVGGDFFDIAVHGDQALVLSSDVIGHGVQAALTTMLLKGIFQEAAEETQDPVELLTSMNRRLNPILPNGMYAAGAVMRVQSGSSQIALSNAGLPYPFVLRKQKRLDEIVLAGPPLGLFPGDTIPYEPRTIDLAPGDLLLVGSDGIGSIPGNDGAMFEDQALRKTLEELAGESGETVLSETLKRAQAFGNDQPLPDDVSLLAIARR